MAIAQATLRDAPILILGEPTAATSNLRRLKVEEQNSKGERMY